MMLVVSAPLAVLALSGRLFCSASATSELGLRVRPHYLTDPQDQEWLALGDGTRERAKASSALAAAAAARARATAIAATASSPTMQVVGADAEAEAQEALQDALVYNAKSKELLPGVEEMAYAAGRQVAEREVRRLEGEAQEYFRALEADFAAKAKPQLDEKTRKLLAEVQPYDEAGVKLQALARQYNEQAIAAVMQARRLAARAKFLAKKAGYEQAGNQTKAAWEHMWQANQTVAAASKTGALGGKIRRFAESLNNAVPMYKQAAQMALEHAIAGSQGFLGSPA